MSIHIGYNSDKKEIFVESEFSKERKINQSEIDLLNKIATDIGISDFEIVNNTEDYTTLKYKEYDLVRLKYTDKAKWISLFLTKDDKSSNIDNPLFEVQKNKKQLFWKSNITQDVDIYYPFIKHRYDEIQ